MKKLIFTFCIIFIILNLTFAQNDSSFDRKGEIYGDLFLNTNYQIENKQASFRFNRLHFGYKYNFTEKLYFNGMLEAAKEDYIPAGDYNNIVNLFEFCLGYNSTKFDAKFGLIGTEFNQMQEQLWKHRNIDKVFADKYGFAPTNDFGFLLIYKPAKFINLDISITNGEGHKSIQMDSAFRYAIGTKLILSKFFIRAYTDFVYFRSFQQINFIGIAGFSGNKIAFGTEWNQQFNSNNNNNYQRYGLSAYFSINFTEKLQLFSRYDFIRSNMPENFTENWNIINDGDLIIAGMKYNIIDKISIAPNYRAWIANNNSDINSFIFLDLEIKF